MLHVVADPTSLHRLDKPKFVPLAQMRLIKVVIGTADPNFIGVGFDHGAHFKQDKFLAERGLNTDRVVRIVCLIVDQDVALRVPRTHLVPEDFAAATSLIDLGVVEASKLIKGNLTVSVKDQDWQEGILLQILDQKVITVTVLLSVEGKDGESRRAKLCIDEFINLERMEEGLSVAHSDHLCDFLDELFDSRVMPSVTFVQSLEVTQ